MEVRKCGREGNSEADSLKIHRVVLEGRPCNSCLHELVELIVGTRDTVIDFNMNSITSIPRLIA